MHRPRANFEIVAVSRQAVLIRDVGPWDRFPSVTNDAERVVAVLADRCALSDRRLFYLDSEDELAELVHDGQGGFRHFELADATDCRRLDLIYSSATEQRNP